MLTYAILSRKLYLVIGFQILERTGTAGGPEGPPLIISKGITVSKPYLNYQQQIQKLVQDKGLIITDYNFAEENLKNIGYFSLIGGYKDPFINPMTRKYEDNATFEDLVRLYTFDEDLRNLTFKYLTKVEQKLRQLVSDSFCSQFGVQQSDYLSATNYTSNTRYSNDVTKLITILDYHANKNTDQEYLVYQRRVYQNVPLWVITKALTFGQLSKFYSLLQFREQSIVCHAYKYLNEKNLGRYIHALTYFRNVCAHNERLYSHRLHQIDFPDSDLLRKMNIKKTGNKYNNGKQDYFGLVVAFRYLLPKSDFLEYKKSLKRLIDKYLQNNNRISRDILLNKMGMPDNWERITRYKL